MICFTKFTLSFQNRVEILRIFPEEVRSMKGLLSLDLKASENATEITHNHFKVNNEFLNTRKRIVEIVPHVIAASYAVTHSNLPMPTINDISGKLKVFAPYVFEHAFRHPSIMGAFAELRRVFEMDPVILLLILLLILLFVCVYVVRAYMGAY